MRSVRTLGLLALCLAMAALMAHADVIELNDSNFLPTLQSSERIFVKFFAPWCGHCKNLAPAWKELGKTQLDPPAKIASVDCTKNRDICRVMGIRGFPTLILMDGPARLMTQHRGPRELSSLVGWVQAADPREPIPEAVFSPATTDSTKTTQGTTASVSQQFEEKLTQVKKLAAEVQGDVMAAANANKNGVVAVAVTAGLAGLLLGLIFGRCTAPKPTIKVKST